MDSALRPYTQQESIEGVLVIGFVARDPGADAPEATYDRDAAEFNGRMAALAEAEEPGFVVVDFSNYRLTGWDNGRAVVSSLLAAHRSLKTRGGGLVVCNHPAQLNPDFPGADKTRQVIDICRSRQEALGAVRARKAGTE
ncbi:MAG: hypothetical protein K2V38_18055 [Gemmataceae bacterium]|nr:hypothetical protein [Gemmataceae bacterium]